MLTANQVRSIKESLRLQGVEVDLYKILKDIAEDAICDRSRGYVYADLEYSDERVDMLVNKIQFLGYRVEASKYPEDSYSSLTIKF